MLDIGMTELLIIGVVALIVVGPKDLPAMFRTLGRFTAKAKSMAREFQRAMEDAADESGMKETSDDLKSLTSAKNLGLDKVKTAADKFEKWQPKDIARAVREPGPETEKLSEERAATAEQIREATAQKAAERRAAEAAEPAAGDTADAGRQASESGEPRRRAGAAKADEGTAETGGQ